MKDHRKIQESFKNDFSRNNGITSREICDNKIDDDQNGLTDIKDFACYFSYRKQDTCIQSKIIWATFSSRLYRLDMETKADTVMNFPRGEAYDDISWAPNGKLYGAETSSGAIYEIDPNTARTKLVSLVLGHYHTNGMGSDAESNLYLSSITSPYGTWHVVKLNPVTGKSSIIADLSAKGLECAGDVTFLNGYLYVSCIEGKLAKIDVATGDVQVINLTGDGNGYGLVTSGDGYLYISNGIGLNRIDPETWISSPYYVLPTYGYIYGLSIYNEYCDAPGCSAKAKINIQSTSPFCSDSGVLLEGTGSGIVGPTELFWTLPGGQSVARNIMTVFNSGKYYLNYKSLAEDCSALDSIDLNIITPPVVSLGNDTVLCAGNSLVIQPLNTDGNNAYLWQNGITTPQYTVTNAGMYFVKVTNKFGCSATDTIEVIDKTVPGFSIGKDTIVCEGAFNLMLQPEPAVEGKYSWNTRSTGGSLPVTVSGYYQLEVNNYGCLGSAGISISTKGNPIVFLGNDTTLCEGAGITLDASFAGAVYTWQDGSAGSTYKVNKPGAYSVTLNLDGCMAKDTIVISHLDKAQFTLGGDTTICPGQQIILRPVLNGPVNYLWQDGSTQPYFTIKDSGLYLLQASNICGSYSDEIYVGAGNCRLLLPNAFSPNTDGLNDVFKVIYPLQFTQFRLMIFNRFGEKVFETNNMKCGWDGRYKGSLQPVGLYVWEMHITERGNVGYVTKGLISLIR